MFAALASVLPSTTSHDLPLDAPNEPTAAADYEPFLPDKKYYKTSPPDVLTLEKEQEATCQKVLEHFAAEDYVIPDLEDGDGKLTEEEKFYLVSSSF